MMTLGTEGPYVKMYSIRGLMDCRVNPGNDRIGE